MKSENRIAVAIIGSGNIGTDLMIKALRSERINPVFMVGIDSNSDGLRRAEQLGLKTTHDGINSLIPVIKKERIKIAFDATSAYVHPDNARKLQEQGVVVIDLTPAAIGPYCIPPVNLQDHLGKQEMNVNMVTCGGQATIPMVYAVSRVQAVAYGEIIATVASKSAGPGTRKNIDEFTRTTAGAVEEIGGGNANRLHTEFERHIKLINCPDAGYQ